MFRHLPIIPAAIAAVILHACTAPATTPGTDATGEREHELLDRLVGDWVDAPAEDSTVFHEQWRRSGGRDLEGIGFVMLGKDTVSIEFLKILHTDTGTFYSAEIPSQNGSAPVLFRLMSGRDSLVFENPAHDFPTRIVYLPRRPQGWIAHVSGDIRGEERSLRFELEPREKGTGGN